MEKNRLALLREELGLNQSEFAKKLNVTSAAISKIEKGKGNLTERMMNDICREFMVNKEWLISGTGDMFVDASMDEDIAGLMGKVLADDDEFMKRVFLTFAKLTDSERAVIMKVINSLSDK